MMRRATKDLTLSNGLKIPKGERVWVDTTHMLSEAIWENSAEFDPYRFVKLRGTDKDHVAHFVSTSAEHGKYKPVINSRAAWDTTTLTKT